MTGFDNATHTYYLDGVIVPSVTQILYRAGLINFSYVDTETLRQKADIGTKVHTACQMWDDDELDEETLHPVLAGYLDSWKKFREMTGFIPDVHEKMVISRRYKFGGTMDVVGMIGKDRTLVDIKTGCKTKAHPIQTAAYQLLFEDCLGTRINKRMSVYLSAKGLPNICPHEDKRDKYIFLGYLAKGGWL